MYHLCIYVALCAYYLICTRKKWYGSSHKVTNPLHFFSSYLNIISHFPFIFHQMQMNRNEKSVDNKSNPSLNSYFTFELTKNFKIYFFLFFVLYGILQTDQLYQWDLKRKRRKFYENKTILTVS